MSQTTEHRQLNLRTEDDVIAEVNRLRAGYRKSANWSLPQACWHVGILIDKHLVPAVSSTPTPEEAAKKAGFVDKMLATRQSPPGFQAPPALVPSADLTDAAIDHFIESLNKMKAYPHALVGMGPCGPVTIEEFRQVHFVHAEHHLGFLIPTTARRPLRFANTDAVIADIQTLRRGYTQCGNWNLPQVGRHLTIAITNTARPATAPATPEQLQREPIKQQILATGRIPPIQAVERAIPPATCNEQDIDAFIAAVNRVATYAEPTASHPLFGPLTLAEFQRLLLIHCAHHLSHLTPTAGEKTT